MFIVDVDTLYFIKLYILIGYIYHLYTEVGE
jgi:hypothetical protein